MYLQDLFFFFLIQIFLFAKTYIKLFFLLPDARNVTSIHFFIFCRENITKNYTRPSIIIPFQFVQLAKQLIFFSYIIYGKYENRNVKHAVRTLH